MILWRTFSFSQVETHSLLPGSNSTWYLLLSNGCNQSITFLGNSTQPWYVTINNSMHCVWPNAIIKHYEQASFLNMEVGVFHSHAYPFVLVKW